MLTGLTLLFFLRDWRSSLIVVITIPFALLMAVVALWATGQTINIMTLGGLALAVGVLVDEGTVLLENIHVHLAQGEPKAASCPGSEPGGGHPSAACDAERSLGVSAFVFHGRPCPLHFRSSLARGRIFHGRVLLAVQFSGAGAFQLAPEGGEDPNRKHNRGALRPLPAQILCPTGPPDGPSWRCC